MYGTELDGRPRYRLIWSEEATEHRRGVHREFHGKIFLREWVGVKECKKYAYLKDRWVLEKLMFFPVAEIVDSGKGHYEPVWVFQKDDGSYLKPIWEAVYYLVQTLLNPPKHDKAYWDEQEVLQKKKELEKYEEILGIEYIPSMLANKEAIIVPGDIS